MRYLLGMPDGRRGPRRWGLATAALVFCAVAALVAWGSLERRALAERLLVDLLRDRGVPEPSLRVEDFGASGIRVADLSLGRDDEVTASRVTANWTGASLGDGRIERLEVDGLEVRARLEADRISLGFLDALLASGETETGGGGAAELPVIGAHLEAARIALETPGGSVVVRVDADFERGEAQAALRLEPLVFEPGGLQPAQLVPVLGEWLVQASGRVEGQGVARWSAGEPEVRFDVELSGVDLELPFASIEGLAGTLRGVAPPPALPAPQQLSMTHLHLGLDLTDGEVRFGIDSDRVLEIEEARWSLAGGTLRTSGRVDFSADEQRLVFRVRNVDLARLLQSLDIAGLSGEGRLAGELPVVRHGEQLVIRGGRIAADAGGVLRYAPPPGPGTSEAGFDILFAALSNFRYETLSAGIDGDLLGDVRLGLHVGGSNPELEAGRAVKFNLVVDAPLLSMLQGVARSVEIPGAVERALIR